MFDGDGGETLELQAWQIAQNIANNSGSHPCPQCGIITNPVEYLYYKGLCYPCYTNKLSRRK
jgi:hypothetical protein